MDEKIGRDLERFKKIVRGKVRKELQKHISQGGIIGRIGQKKVKVPIPIIDQPRFIYGSGDTTVGQGEGEVGDVIAQEPKEGQSSGKAGDQEGDHVIEVEVSIEDLADLLGEQLKLPMIEPKGRKNIIEEYHKYTGLRRAGPESLRHNKRTFKNALKRAIASGIYDPKKPRIIPVREDKIYRARKTFRIPKANAAIFYIMDVSGSMGGEQKEVVRMEAFWIDTWLRRNYDGIESRYIIHDSQAKEVDQYTFFHTNESGGTMISSSYKVLDQILEDEYNPAEWNMYSFQFSDGDNWSADDNALCVELLEDKILPKMNMFGYGQVFSPYGSGEYINSLKGIRAQHKNLMLSQIKDRSEILKSIQEFFGKNDKKP